MWSEVRWTVRVFKTADKDVANMERTGPEPNGRSQDKV